MPTIENHAEHAFHLPPQSAPVEGKDKDGKVTKDGPLMATPVAFQDGIMFPRAGGVDEEGDPIPSLTPVTDEQLARLKAHPVTKSWFKPAAGRLQLVVSDKESAASSPDADVNALGNSNKAKPKA